MANAIASEAPEGFSSVLREETPIIGASQPLLVHCADERDQSESVADRALELYEQCIALQEQAVLFRAAHHSVDLDVELAGRRIPFIRFGGLLYFEAAHVKDTLAAFRLADNPRVEMAWFRLLQLMPGVGPAKAKRTINALRDMDGKIPLSSSLCCQSMRAKCHSIQQSSFAKRRWGRWNCTRNAFAERLRRSLHCRMTTRCLRLRISVHPY